MTYDELPMRAKHALAHHGITTFEQFAQLTESDLDEWSWRTLPNVGKVSIDAIRQALSDLKIADDKARTQTRWLVIVPGFIRTRYPERGRRPPHLELFEFDEQAEAVDFAEQAFGKLYRADLTLLQDNTADAGEEVR